MVAGGRWGGGGGGGDRAIKGRRLWKPVEGVGEGTAECRFPRPVQIFVRESDCRLQIVRALSLRGRTASLFDLVITRDPERANAQRVAQRMGKDNPEVFIPCRHVYAKFPNLASQNFLPDAVRTQTRLGHTRDAMRPLHAIPRAN